MTKIQRTKTQDSGPAALVWNFEHWDFDIVSKPGTRPQGGESKRSADNFGFCASDFGRGSALQKKDIRPKSITELPRQRTSWRDLQEAEREEGGKNERGAA